MGARLLSSGSLVSALMALVACNAQNGILNTPIAGRTAPATLAPITAITCHNAPAGTPATCSVDFAPKARSEQVVDAGSTCASTLVDATTGAVSFVSPTRDTTCQIQLQVVDKSLISAVTTAEVRGLNNAPQGSSLNLYVAPSTSVPVTLAATDADNDALTYKVVGLPWHGMLSGTAPNLVYRPFPHALGADSIQFLVSDGTSESRLVSVNIAANTADAPHTRALDVRTQKNKSVLIELDTSDVAPQVDRTYSIVSQPTHGTLESSGTKVVYTPATSFVGFDSFEVRQSVGATVYASVTVAVHVVHDVYWHGVSDGSWSNPGNWWADIEHSVPAAAPVDGDSIWVLPGQTQTPAWMIAAPLTIQSYVGITDGASSTSQLTIDDHGNLFLYGGGINTGDASGGGDWGGNATGSSSVAYFDGHSRNFGSVGRTFFAESAANGDPLTLPGTVLGYASFYDQSVNTDGSTLNSDAEFLHDSRNNGSALHNAVFYDASFNDYQGTIAGTASFRALTTNWGSLSTTANFFDSATNQGALAGAAFFYGGSTNAADTYGPTTFSESASNGGQVYGTALFDNGSINNGTVFANAFFQGVSNNNATVDGFAQFIDDSSNSGTVTLNAEFDDRSSNYGAVNGTITCNTSGTCP